MKWTVCGSNNVEKQIKKLSEKILSIFALLVEDLEIKGPDLFDWPNYCKLKGLKGDKRHCHLQKGKPTYVCCWEVTDKLQKVIEVYYVGTHEKAPY